MKAGPESDRVLLAHMKDCLDRITEYAHAERSRFDASRLVQDAVIRNLQTLAESSQRLSNEIKGTEPGRDREFAVARARDCGLDSLDGFRAPRRGRRPRLRQRSARGARRHRLRRVQSNTSAAASGGAAASLVASLGAPPPASAGQAMPMAGSSQRSARSHSRA